MTPELVCAQIIAGERRTDITVEVFTYACVYAVVYGRAVAADVKVPKARIDKGRGVPQVDRAGEDGARPAPVGQIGPGARAPNCGLQRGGAAGGDGDADGVADQDGVGEGDGAVWAGDVDLLRVGLCTASHRAHPPVSSCTLGGDPSLDHPNRTSPA